jgi:hypothetical protein
VISSLRQIRAAEARCSRSTASASLAAVGRISGDRRRSSRAGDAAAHRVMSRPRSSSTATVVHRMMRVLPVCGRLLPRRHDRRDAVRPRACR